MLETGKIRHVPPPETSSCTTCGARYTGEGGPEFVSFDNNANDAEDVPAGLIETAERREGYVAYRVRDPYRGGGSTSITVALMQQCSDCIRQAGELLGIADTAPLRSELELREQRVAELEGQLERSEAHRLEAEAALRETAVYERLLNAGTNANGAEKQAPKRTRAKAG